MLVRYIFNNPILSWFLIFRVEPFLLAHPLNNTCTLNIFSPPTYILHIKIIKNKEYGLNTVVTSLNNLVTC
jgi:hypothetical protein